MHMSGKHFADTVVFSKSHSKGNCRTENVANVNYPRFPNDIHRFVFDPAYSTQSKDIKPLHNVKEVTFYFCLKHSM